MFSPVSVYPQGGGMGSTATGPRSLSRVYPWHWSQVPSGGGGTIARSQGHPPPFSQDKICRGGTSLTVTQKDFRNVVGDTWC